VCQNVPAPDLEAWAHAYYRTNFGRLVRVKGRYDSDDFFNFKQSLSRGRYGSSRAVLVSKCSGSPA
jgi:Berberine and berberine like